MFGKVAGGLAGRGSGKLDVASDRQALGVVCGDIDVGSFLGGENLSCRNVPGVRAGYGEIGLCKG